jgi:hypothetical protein
LEGKTIGLSVLDVLARPPGRIAGAMGMKVLAYDEHQSESGANLAEYVRWTAFRKVGRHRAALPALSLDGGNHQQKSDLSDEDASFSSITAVVPW